MSTATKLRPAVLPSDMTNDELIRAIRTRLKLTVEAIEDVASLIREARRRNLSLVEFSTGMPKRLVMVADGQLDAELLLKHCDHTALLDAIAGVPLETQRALVGGEDIPVVELDGPSGDFVTRSKKLRQLTGPQARLVFADGGIRSAQQQRAQFKRLIATTAKHRAAASASAERGPRVTADATTGELIVGPFRVKLVGLTSALRALGYKLEKL